MFYNLFIEVRLIHKIIGVFKMKEDNSRKSIIDVIIEHLKEIENDQEKLKIIYKFIKGIL